MKDIVTGFKDFILKGNLIELAIAFVMAAAFLALIRSLVVNLFTPIIALIFGEPSFEGLTFEINDAVFFYGSFINDLITFIAVALALYFFVVVPYKAYNDRRKRGETEPDATTKVCPECFSTVAIEARRCPYCTSQIAGTPV